MTTPAQFVPLLWKDAPDTSTPIVASQLNRIEQGIVSTETVARAAIPASQKGVPNGVATLGADGKIPATQSNVDPAAVVLTTGTQQVGGIKTFTNAPGVPDGSFSLAKLALTGTRSSATILFGDGVLRDASTIGGGTGGGGSANALGTPNNPVTDPAAARPTGLTKVWWDCATDPTNWVNGDINLQKGT